MSKKSPQVIAVVGAQWGDEGKGKIIDYLAQDAQVVVRAQGGDNAGHTVVNNLGTFKLNIIPSGIFNPEIINIIGPGTVVNPNTVIKELENLKKQGIKGINLQISQNAHLILDYHLYQDALQEAQREKEIGTTKKGIGPAYISKFKRVGIRAGLLKDPKRLKKALDSVLKLEKQSLSNGKIPPEFQPDFYSKSINLWSKSLANYVVDTQITLKSQIDKGSTILIEGAQGTLIDLDYGTYPYTTSSNPSVNGLLLGSGIPASYLTKTIGIFKSYQSRVGSGGMPTEIKDNLGDWLRKKGHEYGTTTGRPRRVGFFDGVAANYSHLINNFDEIVITRLDILTGTKKLKLAKAYKYKSKLLNHFPTDDHILEDCSPIYADFHPWKEDLSNVKSFHDLPKQAQKYCQAILKTVPGAKLSFIGVGPERESLITL